MSSGGKGGGGAASKQFNYFGTIAGLMGHGPLDGLLQVIVENKLAWEGVIARTAAPEWTPITVAGYGPVFVGWGNQLHPHPQLTAAALPMPLSPQQLVGNDAGHNHPAYTDQVVFVFKNFLGGRERTTFPSTEVVGWRKPRQALITGPAAELDEDRQANPFCVLAELFTHKWLGLGMPLSSFNQASWQAAADKAYANRSKTYISILQTSQNSAKQIAASLLALCDGWLRADRETGACEAGMFAQPEEINPEALPMLTTVSLIEPPEWNPQTWEDVKTKFTVTYTDRTKNYKKRPSAPYEDQRARINVGAEAAEVLERPQIMRAAQADEHAIRAGRRLATPVSKGKLRPPAERIAAVRPGQHIRVDLDPEPGGLQLQQVCRVMSITRPMTGPAMMEVEIEPSLQPVEIAAPVTPPPLPPPEPGSDIPEIAFARLVEAPLGLAGGSAYTLAILASRPGGMVTGFNAYYDRDADGFFPQIGASRAFALRARLHTGIAADHAGVVAVELLDSLNRELVAADPGDAAARDDQVLMLILKVNADGQIAADAEGKAWIEVFSCEGFASAAPDVINVTALRARQGTPARVFAADDEVWFIRRDALTLIEHADFPELGSAPAYFKLQGGGVQGARPLEDCVVRPFSFALVRDVPRQSRFLKRIYRLSLTLPATPTGGAPAGWSVRMPAADGVNQRYYSDAYVDAVTEEPLTAWSAPVRIDGGVQHYLATIDTPGDFLDGDTAVVIGEGNRPYRRVAEAWVSMRPAEFDTLAGRIDQKLTKRPTAPENPRLGNLWIDESDQNKPKVWSGTEWVSGADGRIEQMLSRLNDTATRAEVLQGAQAWANADAALANSISQVAAAAGEYTDGKIAQLESVYATPGQVEAAKTQTLSAAASDAQQKTNAARDAAVNDARGYTDQRVGVVSGQLDARIDTTEIALTRAVSGANRVRNSSFELDSNGDGYADGFGPYNNGGLPVVGSLVPGRLGGFAQSVIFGGPGNNNTQGIYIDIANPHPDWEPGKTYVLSYYAKGLGGHVGRGMWLHWNYNPTSTVALANPPLSNAWQRYAFRLTWGAGVEGGGRAYISTNFWDAPAFNGELHFDDLQIEEGNALTGYAPWHGEATNVALARRVTTVEASLTQQIGQAQTTANAAVQAASNAQAAANGAAQAASTAQTTASSALTAAGAAQSTANAAVTAASSAQTTANGAAQAASTAQTAASQAFTTAWGAQTTASAAVNAAANAQAGVNLLAAEYVLQVVTNTQGQRRVAGIRLTNQGGAGGGTGIVLQADQIALVNQTGDHAAAPFLLDAQGRVYINDLLVKKIAADKIEGGTINAAISLSAAKVAGNTAVYNAEDPTRTFPTTSVFFAEHWRGLSYWPAEWEVALYANEPTMDHTPPAHGGMPRILTRPDWKFKGWLSGAPGFDPRRVGSSNLYLDLCFSAWGEWVNAGTHGIGQARVTLFVRFFRNGSWTNWGSIHVDEAISPVEASGRFTINTKAMYWESNMTGDQEIQFGVYLQPHNVGNPPVVHYGWVCHDPVYDEWGNEIGCNIDYSWEPVYFQPASGPRLRFIRTMLSARAYNL